MFNSVFFAKKGCKGLNETSATKLIAVANTIKTSAESILQHMAFVNTSVTIVGNSESVVCEKGMPLEVVNNFSTLCNKIGTLNGFISWASEGRKAIEEVRTKITNLTVYDYCKEKGIKFPSSPEIPENIKEWTIEDALDTLNVKERATYLELEAKSAQIGKLIHPGCPFDNARKDLYNSITCPNSTKGDGRDLLIYSYNPSVNPEVIDNIYKELQKRHQQYESSLNHIKADLRKIITQKNIEITQQKKENLLKYKEACDKRSHDIMSIELEYKEWQNDLLNQSYELKIAIPACYEEILKELYNVG